ncbi:AAA domain-containing protein [Fusarium keratoplasticum]|nr:AAA domain-containing protein [Fusarium keratoplasticum]
MFHGNSHDTRQRLHDEVHQEDSPSRQPVDLDSDEEMQAPGRKDTRVPGFGANPIIKTMYEDKTSGGVNQWTDESRRQISKEAADDQDSAAIKLFRIKDHGKVGLNGDYHWKICRVDVQNLRLVSALAPILKEENVHLDPRSVATFREPFRPLWFQQRKIVDLFCEKHDDPLEPFLKLFVDILNELFRALSAKTAKLLQSELIDFSTAWTLFPRNSSVYSYCMGSHTLRKVDSAEYQGSRGNCQLVITCKTISFSGEGFYWSKRYLVIPGFTGNKPIRELGCYPFEFHNDKDSITERLTARGRKVLDLQGVAYRTYNGIAIYEDERGRLRQHVNGRILIDAWGYHKYHLNMGQREKNDPAKEWTRDRPEDSNSNDQQQRLSDEDQVINENEMLQKPDELVFMNEIISGFSLKMKLWCQFFVEDIQPMTWNCEAYSQLVLDEQKKDMVLSVVRSHNMTNGTSTTMQDLDIIADKGQGLIVLLSGPPGTGKTLMAEAIAGRFHRPLYHLQADDLGTDVASLGAKFQRTSKIASAWNAIILLDEADVFIAQREPRDVDRNGLFCALLHELEYFSGIIFLTTNLVCIDSAFRSRVTMHLVFPPLTREAREKIWHMFLNRLSQKRRRISEGGVSDEPHDETYAISLDEKDIAQLALWELDGREIKIAIQTVNTWCRNENYAMTLARLEHGIRMVKPDSRKSEEKNRELYSTETNVKSWLAGQQQIGQL